MALPTIHPTLREVVVYGWTTSCASTPVANATRAPFRGKIVKTGFVVGAAFTTDMTVTPTINGTAITGGAITVTASGSGNGTMGTATPTGANLVNEDDYIGFTPSGSTGTSVPGTFFAVIQAG